MDLSFLLGGGGGIQLPDPVKQMGSALTLAQLARQNRLGELDETDRTDASAARRAAAQVFADAQTMGWEAAIQRAAQTNPQGAVLALKLRKEDEGAQLDNEKKRADIDESRGKAKKASADVRFEAVKIGANMAAGLAQTEGPVSRIQADTLYRQLRHIDTPDEILQSMPAPDDPAFKQWAAQIASAATNPKDLAEIWKIKTETPAHVDQMRASARSSNASADAAPINAQSSRISANASAQQAGTSAARLKWDQEQGGKPVLQTGPNGEILAVDPRNATGRPVTGPDGQPLVKAAPKAPEAFQKQTAGIENLNTAIAEYKDALKTWGALDTLSPDARAEMGTKYNNMMLQAKEAYNLGVLNGPDYSILQSVVADPTSLRGAVTSTAAMDKQASELGRIMQVNAANLAKVYKQPAPAAKSATPAKPKLGEVKDGYVYMGGDPADPKSWKKQ